jgi:amidase
MAMFPGVSMPSPDASVVAPGLDRRDFLGLSLAGGAALALGSAATLAAATPGAPALEEATLAGLRAAMEAGRLNSVHLTRQYLARIRAIDQHGPRLHSVLELNPEAQALAAELDRERGAGHPRGPLHGLPVLLKDNIDTQDRMATTAGSLALVGARTPPRDAFVAGRLRAAGALLLGKTNLSEWANLRSTHSVSGWSGRGGLTHNPYALDRNASGSSSGSAVAVAANLCAAAVGTETDGSITSPAALCGIVGLKPTVGLVSRAGIIPLSHTQDTAGPMARRVEDAAILLSAMTGVDPRDPATLASKDHIAPDYTAFLDPDGLRGARLGVARNLFGENRQVNRLMEGVLRTLQAKGAVLVDPVELASSAYEAAEQEVLLYEFKADFQAYMAGRDPGSAVPDMAALIAFNERQQAREMPFFGQELLIQAQAKGPLTDEAYRKALATCRSLAGPGIDKLMDQHRLDALICPTSGPAWLTDLVNGDQAISACCTPAAVAGYPHLTVPAGFVFGLPVGLSLFGRAWSEPTLLKLGYAFEQATHQRRAPRYLPTITVS